MKFNSYFLVISFTKYFLFSYFLTIPIAGDPANFTQIFLFYANDTIAHCFALVNGSRGGTTTTPNGAFGSYNGRPNMVDSSHFPFSRECHHKLKEINRCLILFVSKKKEKKEENTVNVLHIFKPLYKCQHVFKMFSHLISLNTFVKTQKF